MFGNDWKSELLKAAVMLLVVGAEWWMMQPYHEPLVPRMWLAFARFCYRLAGKLGAMGIAAEYNYYQAV